MIAYDLHCKDCSCRGSINITNWRFIYAHTLFHCTISTCLSSGQIIGLIRLNGDIKRCDVIARDIRRTGAMTGEDVANRLHTSQINLDGITLKLIHLDPLLCYCISRLAK
jgi:hypothetical protein